MPLTNASVSEGNDDPQREQMLSPSHTRPLCVGVSKEAELVTAATAHAAKLATFRENPRHGAAKGVPKTVQEHQNDASLLINGSKVAENNLCSEHPGNEAGVSRHLVTSTHGFVSRPGNNQLPPPYGGQIDLASTVQPHIRDKIRERERQAVLLQEKGNSLFFFVLLVSFILLTPCIIVGAITDETRLTMILYFVSDLICLAIVGLYGYFVYQFRNEPAIKARGDRFLIYIFSSTFSSQFCSFIAAIVLIHYSTPPRTTADLTYEVVVSIFLYLASISDAVLFGSMCGRLRVVEALFIQTKVYTQKELNRMFHMPIVVLTVVGLLACTLSVVFNLANHDTTSVDWLFGGYMIMGAGSLAILSWKTWATRKITNLFCDWYQNIRAVVVYFFLWIVVNLCVNFIDMELTVQIAIIQLSHQISLLIFLLDSFSATLYHLWKCKREAAKLDRTASKEKESGVAVPAGGLHVNIHSPPLLSGPSHVHE
eukprot:comp19031_c1_seq1/m.21440 comp19031_c1_seq1/g.21440  ORF comp19031_c1_seq1/g.21440 comp19031_c1_seq1/m.21440 type:complete len:483 (-) comp19031_c1_seq1:318-1766(-)